MRRITLMLCFLMTSILPTEVYGVKMPGKLDGISFQFFVNPVASPEEVMIEIFLINDGNKTIEFEASTSQWYEITLQNQKNEIIYQFSEGRSFLQAIQQLTLRPGETKTWIQKINIQDETRITAGKYKVSVQLLPYSINGENTKGLLQIEDQKEMVIPSENPMIKDVKINKNEENYQITGEARSNSGFIYYTIEDGHHEWIAESKIRIDENYPKWGDFSFELIIPKNKYPGDLPLILYLYGKDRKGNIIHPYPKILK